MPVGSDWCVNIALTSVRFFAFSPHTSHWYRVTVMMPPQHYALFLATDSCITGSRVKPDGAGSLCIAVSCITKYRESCNPVLPPSAKS